MDTPPVYDRRGDQVTTCLGPAPPGPSITDPATPPAPRRAVSCIIAADGSVLLADDEPALTCSRTSVGTYEIAHGLGRAPFAQATLYPVSVSIPLTAFVAESSADLVTIRIVHTQSGQARDCRFMLTLF